MRMESLKEHLRFINRTYSLNGSIESKTIILTQEIAEYWLMHMDERQRKPRLAEVLQIENDIRSGKFILHPNDAMLISTEGKMMNAQHRCLAVIRCGIPIPIEVKIGVPPEMYEYLDQGRVRNVGDFVGGKNANEVSALGAFVCCLEKGGTLHAALMRKYGSSRVAKGSQTASKAVVNRSPSNQDILECIRMHEEEIREIVDMSRHIYNKFGTGSRLQLGAAIWVAAHYSEDIDMDTIRLFEDDYCSPVPSVCIQWVDKCMLNEFAQAKVKRYKLSSDMKFEYYISLIEAFVYEPEITRSPKPFIRRTMKKYSNLVDEGRGIK